MLTPKAPTSRDPSRGVVYVVINDRFFLDEAARNIARLRALEPQAPVAVLSDLPDAPAACQRLGVTCGRVWTPPWVGRGSRYIKTQLARLSPFEQTLFLDSDIVPLRPWMGVFDLIRPGVIGAVGDSNTLSGMKMPTDGVEHAWMMANYPGDTPVFNAGVLLWERSRETVAAFDRWHGEWLRWTDVDQYALVRAGLPLSPIPTIYNDQVQDSETAAFDRGTVFWHHWNAKNAVIWAVGSRERRRVAKMRTHATRRLARAAWRLLPRWTPRVRWMGPAI